MWRLLTTETLDSTKEVGLLTAELGFPSDDTHMHVHTILIVIIFCVVCFLLLVAFFYAFCFRCTLEPLPKDGRPAPSCSLDREDATFRRSSSCPSEGNSI
ncbi:hypothetical protein SKAU_G00365430 [Synaphobranchus kaupii]|uniref:Uncharacterized protein n=1 Tax=Synaphobranchus kaupii TaxID=118154 RepID=A0A9Q1IF96_SYNKA|nr:hypothetical protein SKAU_G00365430 [Synaphobranchus kaupii]